MIDTSPWNRGRPEGRPLTDWANNYIPHWSNSFLKKSTNTFSSARLSWWEPYLLRAVLRFPAALLLWSCLPDSWTSH